MSLNLGTGKSEGSFRLCQRSASASATLMRAACETGGWREEWLWGAEGLGTVCLELGSQEQEDSGEFPFLGAVRGSQSETLGLNPLVQSHLSPSALRSGISRERSETGSLQSFGVAEVKGLALP